MGFKHVSVRQLELLMDYMETHNELALGRVRSKEGRVLSSKSWKELAGILNKVAVGPHLYRSPKDWNRFYNDYKCRVKTKARKVALSQRKTGGDPNDAPTLTRIEKRLCAILGPHKISEMPVEQTQQQEISEDPIVCIKPPSRRSSDDIQTETMEYIELEDVSHVYKVNRQPSTSQCRTSQNSTERELQESEVEETKNMLIDIEKARLDINRTQTQAELERNIIEKQKVEAINNLASAAWALVDVLSNNRQGKAKKRARRPSDSEDDVP